MDGRASVLRAPPVRGRGARRGSVLQRGNGSYATAGVVAGATSAGIAIGVVTQSRRIDRRGSGALMPLGVVHALCVALLILGGLSDWQTVILVGLAFGTGLAVPPTSSLVRSLYPAALGERQRLANQTFALDAAITEITYVIGPALVSLVVLTANTAAALRSVPRPLWRRWASCSTSWRIRPRHVRLARQARGDSARRASRSWCWRRCRSASRSRFSRWHCRPLPRRLGS